MCRRAIKLSQIQDAFNPAPLASEIELNEFYLDTSLARTGDSYSDFVRSISVQLEDSKEVYQHKLFIGHPGCGKTTELYQLLQKTKSMDFLVCFGRCDLELDSADVEYTDVLFLILDLLVHAADENGIKLSRTLVQSIYDYWEQEIEETESLGDTTELEVSAGAEGEAGFARLFKILAQVKGIIKNSSESRIEIRRKIEPRSSELISRIQEVIESISCQSEEIGKRKIPLIILDGLDKIPLDQARKIFKENGSRFSSLNVHLIITFPIALTYTPEYSDILTWFPNPEKLPMIKLRKWDGKQYVSEYEEGSQTMCRIVEKRADLTLFEPGVLEELIRNTGGYIRDLFRCISKAALRARMRNASAISIEDANVALNYLESDINGRYRNEWIPVMRTIYEGEKYRPSSDEMTSLLQIGAVLEYNGERWCDLHPLVERWLKAHGNIE